MEISFCDSSWDSFLRSPKSSISVWQMGKKIHVAKKKLLQDLKRWTWKCHSFTYWVNAKIGFYWKILLFTFSGSKADDNIMKYFGPGCFCGRKKKMSDENKALGWFGFWWLCFERTVQCWSALVKIWSGKHQIMFNGRTCIFHGFIFCCPSDFFTFPVFIARKFAFMLMCLVFLCGHL